MSGEWGSKVKLWYRPPATHCISPGLEYGEVDGYSYSLYYQNQLHHVRAWDMLCLVTMATRLQIRFVVDRLMWKLRCEVLTALKMSMFVFCSVTPYGLVGRYQRFRGTYCMISSEDGVTIFPGHVGNPHGIKTQNNNDVAVERTTNLTIKMKCGMYCCFIVWAGNIKYKHQYY